ncbi:MAG: ethanolamine utilization protein EutJ [Spirochaetaceae bacterium]|jgi:ethanolamine utilization protein EutJ|nr:ethanolamine utilization protein EutJ [Spirochaetaceae bacterium]
MDLTSANAYIESFAAVLGKTAPEWEGRGKLKCGVDLGTANICIAVLDENDKPVSGEIFGAQVVRDGLVYDYSGSVAIVRKLKARIEERLGRRLETAAAAIPPGTVGRDAECVANVVRAADFDVTAVVDEPTAAARALGAKEGAVVDIGGGTTGISILRNGKVAAVHDEPTGGTHMTLVVAGHYGMSFDEAERYKVDPANAREVFPLVKPVAEKMATIVRRFLENWSVETIYAAGGACAFDGFEKIIERECGIPTVKPAHSLLVTPLGIAMFG